MELVLGGLAGGSVGRNGLGLGDMGDLVLEPQSLLKECLLELVLLRSPPAKMWDLDDLQSPLVSYLRAPLPIFPALRGAVFRSFRHIH